MSSYSLAEVARICRVPASRLRRWERMALLRRAPGRSGAPAFEFGDLVAVRRLRGLLERGVPLRQIRRGVQALRARRPDLDRPVAALDVSPAGAPRVVLREAGVLAETDGQLVLDLAGSEARARIAALERGARARAGAAGASEARSGRELLWSSAQASGVEQTASDLFEIGCRLDSDPKTFGEAIDAYERALAVDPEHADSHCNLGSIYYNQGRRGPARACFERALAVDAGHVEANLNLATMLEEEERNVLALRHYRRALETDPCYADAHVSAALLHEKLGRRRAAREHWRRYLQIDPGGAWADVARRHLGAGAD